MNRVDSPAFYEERIRLLEAQNQLLREVERAARAICNNSREFSPDSMWRELERALAAVGEE